MKRYSDSTQLPPPTQQSQVMKRMRVSSVSPVSSVVILSSESPRTFTPRHHSAITRTGSRFSSESIHTDRFPATPRILRTPGRSLRPRLRHPPRGDRAARLPRRLNRRNSPDRLVALKSFGSIIPEGAPPFLSRSLRKRVRILTPKSLPQPSSTSPPSPNPSPPPRWP